MNSCAIKLWFGRHIIYSMRLYQLRRRFCDLKKIFPTPVFTYAKLYLTTPETLQIKFEGIPSEEFNIKIGKEAKLKDIRTIILADDPDLAPVSVPAHLI